MHWITSHVVGYFWWSSAFLEVHFLKTSYNIWFEFVSEVRNLISSLYLLKLLEVQGDWSLVFSRLSCFTWIVDQGNFLQISPESRHTPSLPFLAICERYWLFYWDFAYYELAIFHEWDGNTDALLITLNCKRYIFYFILRAYWTVSSLESRRMGTVKLIFKSIVKEG